MSTELQSVIMAAGPLQVRGTSSYTIRLAAQLPEFGFNPTIITPDCSALPDEVRPAAPIHEFGLLDSPLFRKLATRLITRDVTALNPRLVHIQSRHAFSFGTQLARRLGVPAILTLHDFDSTHSRLATSVGSIPRIVAVSSSVRDALVNEHGVADELVKVIHSGVPVPDLVDNAEILAAQRTPVIGTAGPLEASKGLPYFVQAARNVLDAGHDAEFLIAGAGPEERRLRALSRQLNLTKHITFMPNLPDFRPAIRAMDVFCLPSLTQGLGTVMLEAMALGRPVIATDVGGISSIVSDGETGLMVPASDSDRLSERVLELLADPIRARAIGSAARQRVVDAFDSRRMLELTVAEYHAVLGDECPEKPE